MNDFYHELINQYPTEKYGLLKAQTFNTKHFGFPEIYYKIMETDAQRVGAFKRAFEYYDDLKDKVICEVGVGKLALTRHYLPFVKKAYLIESNVEVISFIQSEIKSLGFEDKVELIVADALTVELAESVDFIIAEMMSIFCANEFQVQVFKHLRQFLKKDGHLIPEKIQNFAQLAYNDFDLGIDHFPLNFTRHLPEFLSTTQLVNQIDLYKEKNMKVEKETVFEPIFEGKVNALYLQSFVNLAKGVNFTGTDSLMPPTVIKTANTIRVKPNDKIMLKSSYSYGTSLDEAVFQLNQTT
jgi:predicted RNA methylase